MSRDRLDLLLAILLAVGAGGWPVDAAAQPERGAGTRGAGHARTSGERARAYAEKHDFPVTRLEAGPEGRRVERYFVPITNEETHESFKRTFGTRRDGENEGNREHDGTDTGPGVYLNYVKSPNSHVTLGIKPEDNYIWGRNYNGTVEARRRNRVELLRDRRSSFAKFQPDQGYTIAVRLSESELAHLKRWLDTREDSEDALYCAGKCMDWLSNAKVQGPDPRILRPDDVDRNYHPRNPAEQDPGTTLFDALGLKRSRDGDELKAKIIHAANERADVIGVHVRDLDEFQRRTESAREGNERALKRPPPEVGVEGAVAEGSL